MSRWSSSRSDDYLMRISSSFSAKSEELTSKSVASRCRRGAAMWGRRWDTEVVLHHMIRNLCGSRNPAAVCMGIPGGARKTFLNLSMGDTAVWQRALHIAQAKESRRTRWHSYKTQVDNSWVVAHNPKFMRINANVGSSFPGSKKTFLSTDTVEKEDQNGLRYPVELLTSFLVVHPCQSTVFNSQKGS